MSRWLLALIIIGSAACSHKAIYNDVRLNQRNQCVKEPTPTYEECVNRASKPYDEYERERKELLK